MIDWNAPLEAVDKDTGEVFAVTCAGKIPGPHLFGLSCYQAAWVMHRTQAIARVFRNDGYNRFWRLVNAK